MVDPIKVKEEFISIYKENITREGSEKLLDYLINKCDFFTAPASTRFHSAYAGGLAQHSLNVYYCLKDYLSRERVKETYKLSYTDEQIAETMRQTWQSAHYLLDPHGACGFRALQEGLQPDEVGIFLETAHPAKFKDTVEAIIGEPVAIPEKLQAFMRGTKQSVSMSSLFADFKAYLLQQPS